MNGLSVSPWLAANLERLGWTLVHFLWQGTAVAALLAVELAVLRRASAQLRYLAGVVAAMAALLMPVMTFVMLGPVVAGRSVPVAVNGSPARQEAGQLATGSPGLTVSLVKGDQAPVAAATPSDGGSPRREARPVAWKQNVPVFAAQLQRVLPWCGAGWMLGVVALSVRLLVGWTQAQRLCRRGAQASDARWQLRLEALARRMGVRRVVRLLESTVAEVPAVIGALRPVILLPVGMLVGLSTAQVEMILAHELAHIRRQDYLVNLGLTLFETLGFYHPAVWWIAARVREEREHACDDLAVQATGDDRVGYARALTTLEEMRGPVGGVALAATSGGRGTLLARVRRLLGVVPERKPRSGRNAGWLAGALALLITGALTVGSFQHPARAQTGGKPVPGDGFLGRGRVQNTYGNALPLGGTAETSPALPDQLTGRVVDEAGNPVAGALVYDEADDGGHIALPPRPITTDTGGVFRVPKFKRPGQWRFIGARLDDTSIGWLDIGAGRQPAAYGADNVLTQPIVLRARKYALRGNCVDEQGNPLVGVQIRVSSLPGEGHGSFVWQDQYPEVSIYQFWAALVTLSDKGGVFSLPVPLQEGMQVEIGAPGRQIVYPFEVIQGGTAPSLDLGRVTLAAAGSISGRVVFVPRDGGEVRPLAKVLLLAVNAAQPKATDIAGPREYQNIPFSDAQGRYHIEHLPPGTYTVSFFGPNEETPGEEPVAMAAAENVILRAGETTPLDLRAVPGRSLRVRVVDSGTNRPVADLPVDCVGPSRPATAKRRSGVATSDRGECTLELAPGHYRVFTSEKSGSGNPELASVEVDVPAEREPDPVLLQITAGPHLRGKVQDVQGKSIPLTGGASVLLLETSPEPGGRQAGSQSSSGSFDIPLTKTGIRARLVVDVAGYRAFLSPEFAVTKTPEPMTATLEIAPDFAIRGRAVDQDGHPVVHGYVTGTIFAGRLSYSVQLGSGIPGVELFTDGDGRFETHRIRQGTTFRLDVFAGNKLAASTDDRIYFGKEFQGSLYEIGMHPAPIIRAAAPDVVIGPRDLAGHVVDAQGKPLEGAVVTLSGTSSPEPGGATTNAAGGFRIQDFSDRHYVYLAVNKEGYATHWVTDLTVGKDFTVSLQNSTRFRGQFVLPDGAPAGRTHIILRTNRPTARAFMMNPIMDLRVNRDTDEHGAYDFPVEAGEYSAQIVSPDGSLVAAHESIKVEEGKSAALPATLSAGLTLRMQALDRMTGRPAAGVKFHIEEMTDATALGIRPDSQKQTDEQGFVQWEHLFPGNISLSGRENDVYQRIWSYDDRIIYPQDVPRDRPPQGNEGNGGQITLKLTAEKSGEPVILQVERGVKIFGDVLDAAGKPAVDVALRAVMDRRGQKDRTPDKYPWSDLVPFRTYEQTGSYQGYIPAGNGLPARIGARPQDDGQGGTLSEPFDSQPGGERRVNIHLNKGGTVEGSVVDKAGKPLSKVSVIGIPLDHLDNQEFMPWGATDEQGRFRFEHVRPTEYEVTTTVVPHMSVGDEPPQEKRRVVVPAGGHVAMEALHFDPAGWNEPVVEAVKTTEAVGLGDLAGHVVDNRGAPIAGAKVTLAGPYPNLGPVTTDVAGRFRFPAFSGGRFVFLAVEKAGYGLVWQANLVAGTDFEVRLDDTTRLRGQLLKPDGSPAGAAAVTLFKGAFTKGPAKPWEELRQDLRTDEHGGYDLPVQPGEYRVEIKAEGENLVARYDKFEVPPGQATALPGKLEPGLTLRIQTVDSETGQPAPGARFHLRDWSGPVTLQVRPGNERQTDAQGFAEWDHLFPGQTILDLSDDPVYARFWSTDPRESSYLSAPKVAHPADNSGEDGSLFIRTLPGSGGDPVVVRIERGVRVSGRMFDPDGKPVEGATVHAIITAPDLSDPAKMVNYGLNHFQAITAADGSFRGCAPASNGGVMRLIGDKYKSAFGNAPSEPFTSTPGDEREVTIRLTTAGWIDGSVVNATGQPQPNVPLTASAVDQLDGYQNHDGFVSDAQGRFRIGPLRPADYKIRTRNSQFTFGSEPAEEERIVTIKAGETVSTEPLHYEPAGWTAPPAAPSPAPAADAGKSSAVEMLTARVKIVDEANKPIVGATVTPDGLRPRGNAGGHYLWLSKELGPPLPATTDATGIAVVRYPRLLIDGQKTGAISFRVEHPDYCAVRPTNYRVENTDGVEAVTLRRGATLGVSGHLPGSSAAVPISPQQDDPTHESLSPTDWKEAGGNRLETRQLPVGRNYVRLTHAAADGHLFFSETKLINAVSGQTYTLDLPLQPGVRVEGRLDASVPRPVRGGKIVIRAYATSPESDASFIDWNSWRAVTADGTFVFESLPPGRLEVAALCEGYTSVSGPDTKFGDTLNIPRVSICCRANRSWRKSKCSRRRFARCKCETASGHPSAARGCPSRLTCAGLPA